MPHQFCRIAVLAATLAIAAGCGGPALFTVENERSWEKMCPPESEESRFPASDSNSSRKTTEGDVSRAVP